MGSSKKDKKMYKRYPALSSASDKYMSEKKKAERKDWFQALLAVAAILGILFFAVKGCIIATENTNEIITNSNLNAKFKVTDMVRSKVSGQKGQVINKRCHEKCEYLVRFNAVNTRTDINIIERDGFVENYPLVSMWVSEFELEKF